MTSRGLCAIGRALSADGKGISHPQILQVSLWGNRFDSAVRPAHQPSPPAPLSPPASRAWRSPIAPSRPIWLRAGWHAWHRRHARPLFIRFIRFTQHARSSMHAAACPQQHARSSMPSAACPQQHARSSMHAAACTQQHARSSMHAAACTQQHARSVHSACTLSMHTQLRPFPTFRLALCGSQCSRYSNSISRCKMSMAAIYASAIDVMRPQLTWGWAGASGDGRL